MDKIEAFFKAVEANDLAAVERWLKQGGKADVRNEHGQTALMVAPHYAGLEMAKLLARYGADVNARNEHLGTRTTPLTAAVTAGNLPVVRWLLDQRADVRAATSSGMTALFFVGSYKLIQEKIPKVRAALQKDETEIARLLVARGANVNATTSLERETPLHIAALKGLAGVADILLKKGANVNAQSKEGASPLMLAASQGWRGDYGETIRLLLAHGANRKLRNHEGDTALDIARRRKNRRIVALLAA